jgi:hypothetical protein
VTPRREPGPHLVEVLVSDDELAALATGTSFR